jgi:hypothetical protein
MVAVVVFGNGGDVCDFASLPHNRGPFWVRSWNIIATEQLCSLKMIGGFGNG